MSVADDVWDIEDLLRMISALNLDKLQYCQEFLRKELRLSEPRQSNEVRTLMRLIEVLSASEEGVQAGDNREDPDPEGKIRDRFADHAEFLQQEYVTLKFTASPQRGELIPPGSVRTASFRFL